MRLGTLICRDTSSLEGIAGAKTFSYSTFCFVRFLLVEFSSLLDQCYWVLFYSIWNL